jgi:hypothetical protein
MATFKQPINKFPAFYRTRIFNTTLRRRIAVILSQINPVQTLHLATSRLILMLNLDFNNNAVLPKGLLHLDFSMKSVLEFLISPMRALRFAYLTLLHSIVLLMLDKYQNYGVCQCLHSCCLLSATSKHFS